VIDWQAKALFSTLTTITNENGKVGGEMRDERKMKGGGLRLREPLTAPSNGYLALMLFRICRNPFYFRLLFFFNKQARDISASIRREKCSLHFLTVMTSSPQITALK